MTVDIKAGLRNFATIEKLAEFIVFCAEEYEDKGVVYDADGVEVSDPEYDTLVKQLRKLDPNNKVFAGASPAKSSIVGKTIKHDPPLTSIDKADGTEDDKKEIYEKWIASCSQRLGRDITEKDIAQEYKRDGNCVRINYINGKLVSAGTRSRDGTYGTDITGHVKHIKGVFDTLPLPLTLSLNGEVECWMEDFDAINAEMDAIGEDTYSNPRNYTAGVLGRDDPDEAKGSRLRVAYHSITGLDDWKKYYSTVTERAKWANSKDGLSLQDSKGNGFFVRSMPHRFKDLAVLEQKAADMPYYIDGVVLKINNIEDYEELGHTADDLIKPPRATLAWKFAEESKQAVCGFLEWNASRTGRVVPTAIFDKTIRLADTDVSRATCNNYGWVVKMGIGSGAVLLVKKAGKIIPNVCGVIKSASVVNVPDKCPSCKSTIKPVVSSSGNTDLVCFNDKCSAKQIHSWLFYITKLGGKGIGAAAMEKIANTGKVQRLDQLYALAESDLINCDFSERQATLALAAIHCLDFDKDNDKLRKKIEVAKKSRMQVEAAKFYAALGIPGSGDSDGKSLVKHFKDFDKIRYASKEELESVSGIGKTTAEKIVNWFQANNSMVEHLLNLHVELKLPKSGKLDNQNFCLTGSFDLGKKHWQSKIEEQGGNVQSGVGKDTNYLVIQNGKSDGSPSDKEQKAAKYGTSIISVVDLEKML